MSVTEAKSRLAAPNAAQRIPGILIVGGVIFAAALFGILTRPVGFLASFWPANAILLGMMVRNPRYAGPAGWAAAFVGYVAADILTGGGWYVTAWLTAANMVSAITGYLLFRLVSENDRKLQHPVSVLYLFGICCMAAVAAAFAGGGAVGLLFDRTFAVGFKLWFVTELVNTLVILPAILTFPGVRSLSVRWPPSDDGLALETILRGAPCLALILSVAGGVLIGGPGALAFPIPALLWCALTYSLFTTSVMTLLLCIWLLISIPAGLVDLAAPADPIRSLDSIRLGIALMALGPLTVASINTGRRELIARLQHIANYDALTGALSRGAFFERGQARLDELIQGHGNIAVLMIDLDHFKRVNDEYGHGVGDAALKAFFPQASKHLRAADLIGRLGGEEFAVLMPLADMIEATALAERIRLAVEATEVALPSGEALKFTVSIGVSAHKADASTSIDAMLAAADQALYEAKAGGRNQVRVRS
ncbi:GGDEF domain-containing protein [Aminobacter niigataensis]|uniref:GGDEF domain-containing protein n=1 Tax=Aminobacter niigataensis TaxID=83265 RepID=UPI0024C99078|nr:diguanylate cyclase [Aminobacter niigataensis]CAI2932719.1 putative membrane-associated diguanylate cyclase [Aminobacter niigataensis]